MRCTRSQRSRANIPCGSGTSRRRSSRCCANSASASCPFSPLGRGFLTGTARRAEEYPEGDYRRGDPRFQGANFDLNMRAATVVGQVAAELGATPSQVALAWVLQQGKDFVPIPGTKRRRYLEENVAAADLRLGPAALARLEATLPPGGAAGPRYNESMMSYVDR